MSLQSEPQHLSEMIGHDPVVNALRQQPLVDDVLVGKRVQRSLLQRFGSLLLSLGFLVGGMWGVLEFYPAVKEGDVYFFLLALFLLVFGAVGTFKAAFRK